MTTITLKTLLSVAQFSRLKTVKGGKGVGGGENVETALHEYFFRPRLSGVYILSRLEKINWTADCADILFCFDISISLI